MDYEKKYKEALERAKKVFYCIASDREPGTSIIEYTFPELAESEDKKIKKALILVLQNLCKGLGIHGLNLSVDYKDMLDWVIKQGEVPDAINVDKMVLKYSHTRDGDFGLPVNCMISAYRQGLTDVISILNHEKQDEHQNVANKEYTFKVIPRLLEMIQPTDKAKSYCQKLIDSLEQEGYSTDAKIVRGCLKQMNGEKVSMATMDGQKPADKYEPKFYEGDWIVSDLDKEARQISEVHFDEYNSYYVVEGEARNLEEYDRLHHLWTIQDAKDGDVLSINWREGDDYWEKIIIFKKYHNKGVKGLYSMPCVEGYGNTFKNGRLAINEEVPYYSKTWTCNLCPATKEQRDTLFTKMHDAGYTFDFETKELKKIEEEIEIPFGAKDSELQEVTYFIPKGFHAEIDDDKVVIKKGEKPTAWSEEDEHRVKDTIYFLESARKHYASTVEIDACIDWLKSLKDRVGCEANCTTMWKPSDEQVEAVRLARAFVVDDFGEHPALSEILIELEEQLKKLKE